MISQKQQQVIDAHQYLLNINVKPTLSNLAKHIYNDASNNSQMKVRQKIETLKAKKLWPSEEEQEKEDIEMWAMTNIFRLIKSLKKLRVYEENHQCA